MGGLLWARYFIRPLKIACLHSLRSWAINFAFSRLRLAGKMIIYARLRFTKIIFFRGLIKYLAHNHPHITTIVSMISYWSKAGNTLIYTHADRHYETEIWLVGITAAAPLVKLVPQCSGTLSGLPLKVCFDNHCLIIFYQKPICYFFKLT